MNILDFHSAARDGDIEKIKKMSPLVLRLLLRLLRPLTSIVDIRREDGGTALHVAADTGNTMVALALLDRGASPNARDSMKCTPLHSAAFRHRTEVARLLLERGARINVSNAAGDTPLHYAAGYAGRWDDEIIPLLLKAGAKLNVRDKYGRTPLLRALDERAPAAAVDELLNAGADTRIVSETHDTPLTAAAAKGRMDLVTILLKHGADVNCPRNDGATALHSAALNDRPEIVRLLLDHGAKPDAKTTHGKTPYDLALQEGNQPIVALLKGCNVAARLLPGVNVGLVVSRCVPLLQSAHEWGEREGFSAAWMKKSPQFESLRSLGREVSAASGLSGMRAVIQGVRQSYRHGHLLDHFWDGIGGWVK